jgi:hypothetical protein
MTLEPLKKHPKMISTFFKEKIFFLDFDFKKLDIRKFLQNFPRKDYIGYDIKL